MSSRDNGVGAQTMGPSGARLPTGKTSRKTAGETSGKTSVDWRKDHDERKARRAAAQDPRPPRTNTNPIMPIRRQSTTDSIHSIDPTNNLGIKLGDLEATLGEKAYVLGEWLRDFEQKENVLEERQRVLEDRESALDKREAKLQERESSLSLESGQSETANASKLGKLDVEAERVNIEKVYNQMREMKKRDRRLRDTLKELDLEWVLGPAARQEPASDFF